MEQTKKRKGRRKGVLSKDANCNKCGRSLPPNTKICPQCLGNTGLRTK